jgi:actin-related protein 10
MIAKLLFDYFQVPSISFVPTHLMALLTTGLTTGLVIDVGNLETSVLPVSRQSIFTITVSLHRMK